MSDLMKFMMTVIALGLIVYLNRARVREQERHQRQGSPGLRETVEVR